MGNSNSVCSLAHAAGGVGGGGVGGGGWGEKGRRGRGGGGAQGGRGRGFFLVSFGKWWEGVLTSPITHTLQKDTTPSSWRQRERAQKGNGGETEDTTTGDKTQGNTGVRYWRETCV